MLEALTSIRFGTGRHPAKPDLSPEAMMAALSGPDLMAQAHPIPGWAVLLPIAGEVRRLSKEAKKNRGTDKGKQANLAKRDLYQAERSRQQEMLRSTLARWVDTDDPLRERMTRFWADHFTTIGKGGLTRRAVSLYVEDAIRPHVTGRFSDMLRAVVTHPMMLLFLDQDRSIGPTSKVGQRRAKTGINENLAREVLELHTLGVGGPYTQTDVRQLATLFTGMTVQAKRGFKFNPNMAEPGETTVLGRHYGRAEGELDDILAALDDLAVHPATARHVAQKLAVHFVSDTPHAGMVANMQSAFEDTGGDLMAVYNAMMAHPSAFELPLKKAKQPIDLIATTLRALALDVTEATPKQVLRYLVNPMRRMGQLWQEPTGPDGWPEDEAHWITPQGLAARIEWTMGLNRVKGLQLPDPRDFVEAALGPMASEQLRFAAGAAESTSDGVGVILASPDFQRR